MADLWPRHAAASGDSAQRGDPGAATGDYFFEGAVCEGGKMRGASMSLETWKSFFEIGGVILLFLTFVFGAGLVLATNRLNVRQAAQLREFDQKLTDAKTELGKQQERAANADARVAGLEADAADSKAAQQLVELELSTQQERAAKAEKALLELQQRLAHRRISTSDHEILVASLRPYPGSVVEVVKLGDSEAAQFADDIIAVLSEAKWVVRVSTVGLMSPPTYGLVCSVDTESSAGRSLVTVLQMFHPAEVRNSAPRVGVIGRIVVGLKPPA